MRQFSQSLGSYLNSTARQEEHLYCNSIGGSNGYTPIYNADKVKCNGGKCEETQCCEAFCSYHPCPNNYTPVYGADTIKCDDSGCTTDLCCDKGKHELNPKIVLSFLTNVYRQQLPEQMNFGEAPERSSD